MAKSSFFRVPLVGTVLLEIWLFFPSLKKKVGLQWSICNLACCMPPPKFSFPSLLKLKCSVVSQLQQRTHLQQIPKPAGFEQTWRLYTYTHYLYFASDTKNVSLRQSGVCLPYSVACLNVKLHFDQLRHIRIRQTGNVFLVKNGGFIQIKIFRGKKNPNWFEWKSAEKSNVFLICRISESWFFFWKYSISITHSNVAYFIIYWHH